MGESRARPEYLTGGLIGIVETPRRGRTARVEFQSSLHESKFVRQPLELKMYDINIFRYGLSGL